MKWYFVRHGEIGSNLIKVYAGQGDEGLTPRGRRQARAAAQNLAGSGIEAIYSSPLRRAVETAEIIGGFLGKEPILEDCFEELALGSWEGKSEAEIERDFPEAWKVWNTRPAELVLVGRETLGELLNRALQGIAKVKAENGNGSVVIVTHVAIIRVLLLYTRNLGLNLYRTISIPNCKIFLLENL